MSTGLLTRITQPAFLFFLLSMLTGVAVLAIVPPLRAPDENAHLLRAYGISQGDIIPAQSDEQGRRGIFLPSRLHADFSFFENAREDTKQEPMSYRRVFSQYAAAQPQASGGPMFTPYGGSEAYSPVPYIPYVLAAGSADITGISWLTMLYLMRLSGLVLWSAIIAFAIARTPVLPWCFFAVAMLPSSLYTRSVVSADGAVLATSLMALALCFRAALGMTSSPSWRAIWFVLTALTKPSQVAFLALEGMARPLRQLARHWPWALAVTAPALALCIAWVLVTGGDIAAWRLYDDPQARQQFEVGWKLRFMMSHPLHFPAVALTSLDYSAELWRQLIGVLGWLDTRLHAVAYALLSGLLVLASLDRLETSGEPRWRIGSTAMITAAGYVLLVFLLFFLTSTTVDADRIHGLQGRYFVVLIPLLAAALATAMPRRPPIALVAGTAILLAVLSAVFTIEAVLRRDWF